MNKELIVSSNRHETMVATLEDDQVAEIVIERERARGAVGNIYKGRVNKVLPGMQSSFVNIGLDRDAFLYVTDVIDTFEGVREARGGRLGRRPWRRRPRRPTRGEQGREDRGPAEAGARDPRTGSQGAPWHQGRPDHVPCEHPGAIPRLHAGGRAHRGLPEGRQPRGAEPAAEDRPAGSAKSTASPAGSFSGRRPPGVPRKTSSATFRISTTSGPRPARRWTRRGRPR